MTVPAPAHPRDLRRLVAAGEWTAPTAGILDDYQQANLLVVPSAAADDFAEYCRRNPDVCPLLARTVPGNPELTYDNCTVDVRTMLPRYRVWERNLLVAEPTDLVEHWRDDAVAFALGCSHTFDAPLRRAGISVSMMPRPSTSPIELPCPQESLRVPSQSACDRSPLHWSKRRSRSPAAIRPDTASPFMWAIPPRWESSTSPAPTSGATPASPRTQHRCSGHVA